MEYQALIEILSPNERKKLVEEVQRILEKNEDTPSRHWKTKNISFELRAVEGGDFGGNSNCARWSTYVSVPLDELSEYLLQPQEATS